MKAALFLMIAGCVTPAPERLTADPADFGLARAEDPTLSQRKVVAADGKPGDRFGKTVAAVGDVDGDGFDDIAVGAENADDRGVNSGAAYVYWGAGTGLLGGTKLTPVPGAEFDSFGCAVAGAGDVDGDGFMDVIVGASGDDHRVDDGGAAYLFFGAASGITERDLVLLGADGAEDDRLGCAVAGAGDVNGDGRDEVLATACSDDGADTDAGAVYVFRASSTLEDPVKAIRASDGATDDRFGQSLAGLGDADGDGYDDIAIGADGHDEARTDGGAVYVYYGGSTGVSVPSEVELHASDAATSDGFGASVGPAGDVDADGFADLVVGAHEDDDEGRDSGSVYVFYGSASGLEPASEEKLVAPDGDSYDLFGTAVWGAGDMDADGYADVVVGASGDDVWGADSGTVYVFWGGSGGLGERPGSKLTPLFGARDDAAGSAVAGGGDLDGDGNGSVVIGAWGDDELGSDAGAIYLSFGICTDVDEDRVCASDDCDDEDEATHPGAASSDDPTACMTDVDGDNWGETSPAEGVTPGTDCDDADRLTHPGAASIDSETSCMTDGDGDNYGDDAPPAGIEAGTDCNDADREINPGAEELTGDGTDQDCDGTEVCYVDADGDGYRLDGATVESDDLTCEEGTEAPHGTPSGDCDDTDPDVFPGADEVAGDGIDQDCDGFDLPLPLEEECGCASPGGTVGLVWLVTVFALRRRRRRRERRARV